MQRHKQVAAGEDPFGKRTTVPTCKNSPVERLPKQKYLVSKKVLQLDVRRIAQRLGHLPSRDEVREHSGYPVEMFERYFVSWGEVCAAARTTGMSEYPITADEHDEQQVLAFDRPSRHRATDHQRKP
jgi:site-specific DNA-methyltransferase (adenine-specific)